MSYPTLPPPASPAGRPPVVSIAAVLLWVMGAAGLVYAIVTLAVVPGTIDRFRDSVGGTATGFERFQEGADPDTYVSVVWLGAAVAMALAVILFALYIVLGIALRRGSNTGRIATLVVCGVGAVAGAGALVTLGVERGGDSAPWSVGEQLTRAYPSGWLGTNVALAALQILAYALVAFLILAAPKVFFRRTADPIPQPAAFPQYGAPYPGSYAAAGYQAGGFGPDAAYAPHGDPSVYGPASAPPAAGAYGPASAPPAAGAYGPASAPPAAGAYGPASAPPAAGAYGPASAPPAAGGYGPVPTGPYGPPNAGAHGPASAPPGVGPQGPQTGDPFGPGSPYGPPPVAGPYGPPAPGHYGPPAPGHYGPSAPGQYGSPGQYGPPPAPGAWGTPPAPGAYAQGPWGMPPAPGAYGPPAYGPYGVPAPPGAQGAPPSSVPNVAPTGQPSQTSGAVSASGPGYPVVQPGVDADSAWARPQGPTPTPTTPIPTSPETSAGQDVPAGQDGSVSQEAAAGRDVAAGQEERAGHEARAGQEASAGEEARTGQEASAGQEARAGQEASAGQEAAVGGDRESASPELAVLGAGSVASGGPGGGSRVSEDHSAEAGIAAETGDVTASGDSAFEASASDSDAESGGGKPGAGGAGGTVAKAEEVTGESSSVSRSGGSPGDAGRSGPGVAEPPRPVE